jgi:hypothetical protein
MLFWIIAGFYLLNLLISYKISKIRVEWISMTEWLIDQQRLLMEDPNFRNEASDANTITADIIRWTMQSITYGTVTLIATQVALMLGLFVIIFTGTLNTIEIVALLQATTLVFAWITFKRYYKSRGMCYAVQANVDAMRIYNENMESNDGGESGSPHE